MSPWIRLRIAHRMWLGNAAQSLHFAGERRAPYVHIGGLRRWLEEETGSDLFN
jgi:hypothetical protein